MNVLTNMIVLYNKSPADSIYHHVLKNMLIHLRELNRLTIYDLAELTDSSRTTIWRLSKELGYQSFSEFNTALSTAVSQFSLYNKVDLGRAISDPQQCFDRLNDYLNQSTHAFQEVDLDKAQELVALIAKKDRVAFYWPDPNPYIYAFQQNLSMAGKETRLCTLLPEMIADALQNDESALVFLRVLEFTETLNIEPLLQLLQGQHCTIVLMSNDADSRYEALADYSFGKFYRSGINPGNLFSGTYLVALMNELFRGQYL